MGLVCYLSAVRLKHGRLANCFKLLPRNRLCLRFGLPQALSPFSLHKKMEILYAYQESTYVYSTSYE